MRSQGNHVTIKEITMTHHVSVAFGPQAAYEFTLHAADVEGFGRDKGRAWLAAEFEALECTPANAMGKLLILDMILDVAKYGGESRFKEDGDWARQYATAVSAALGRPAIRVDVANNMVG
jgi:hypothetical protein